MPFFTQPGCGYLSPAAFPIRINNGREDADAQPSHSPQNRPFPSLTDLRQALPPSNPLLEYVTNQPSPSHQLHSAIPLSLSAQSRTVNTAPQHSDTPQYLHSHQQQLALPPSCTLVQNKQPPTLRVAVAPQTMFMSPSGNLTSIPVRADSGVIPFPTMPLGAENIFSAEANSDYPSSDEEDNLVSTEKLTEQFHRLALEAHPVSGSEQPRPIRSVCSHPDYPVSEPHSEGIYQYRFQPWSFRNFVADQIARQTFGISNPPPDVWSSLDHWRGDRDLMRMGKL